MNVMQKRKKMENDTLKTIYIDIMEGDFHIGQIPYRYCALWGDVDKKEALDYVLKQRPSLRGRNIRVELSHQRV